MNKDNTICISFKQIQPNIIRSALNVLTPGFSTNYRMIYHYQIIYVYEGKGLFEIEDTNYSAKKGDLFYWGPGEKHKITSDYNEPMTLLGVQFDFTLNNIDKKYMLDITSVKDFNNKNIHEKVIFSDFNGFNHHTSVHRVSKAEELLMEIANEYKIQKNYYEETISALLKVFLIFIARQSFSDRHTSTESLSLTDKVVKYIHEHYQEDITNSIIASVFNFHPNYINKLMVKSTGVSLHKYLINLRINTSIELINETNKTISEIAYEVGFKNIHYFSTLFKKKTGICPSELRG